VLANFKVYPDIAFLQEDMNVGIRVAAQLARRQSSNQRRVFRDIKQEIKTTTKALLTPD